MLCLGIYDGDHRRSKHADYKGELHASQEPCVLFSHKTVYPPSHPYHTSESLKGADYFAFFSGVI
jgi:hypothetical protein